MAIVFTDAELKTVSKEVVDIPLQIASLNDQKVQAVAGQDEALAKDNANKVFYENFKGILQAYYDEKKEIDGTLYTSYDDQNLIDAAKQVQGNPHYPISPVWANFQPKQIPSVTGDPTTPTTPTEIDSVAALQTKINELLNGFTDGGLDDTLFEPYSPGDPLKVNTGGFAVGQRVVVDQGNISLIAEVTAVAPASSSSGTCSDTMYLDQASCELNGETWTPDPPLYAEDVSINVLAGPAGGLGAGARVRNFHPGFSNAEREGTSTPYAPEVLAYFQGLVSAEVAVWKAHLQGQQTALGANTASGAQAGEITAAIADVAAALAEIGLFEGAPASGAGVGRYGDSRIVPLEAARALRATQAPARAAQIVAAFGTLSQAGDGVFSGAGQWFSFFTWIDQRISRAGGTLFAFYNFDLVIKFIDQKIVGANNKKNEFELTMVVKKLTDDANGSAFINVADTVGLSVSDPVKLLDDSALPVLVTTITGINGNTIQLAVPATGYTVDQVARLVKLL